MSQFGTRPEETGPERRTASRHRSLKGGTLRFNKGFSAAECVVRNMSDTGARLSFGDTAAVPNHFDLKISGDDGFRPATVRWRTMKDMGVAFG